MRSLRGRSTGGQQPSSLPPGKTTRCSWTAAVRNFPGLTETRRGQRPCRAVPQQSGSWGDPLAGGRAAPSAASQSVLAAPQPLPRTVGPRTDVPKAVGLYPPSLHGNGPRGLGWQKRFLRRHGSHAVTAVTRTQPRATSQPSASHRGTRALLDEPSRPKLPLTDRESGLQRPPSHRETP